LVNSENVNKLIETSRWPSHTFHIFSRDVKMGQARRAGPPARQKKGGPGWNFQPANSL